MAFPYPYPGPIAPYNNVPINPQYYQPSRFVISALTLGVTTLVTTSVNHNYVVGQTVRLLVPQQFGSYQLNESQGQVTSVPAANQVLVTINSTQANAFISSPSQYTAQAQILAIGDINSGGINSSGRSSNNTFILGAFINISPV